MGRSIQEMYNKFKLLLNDDALFYGLLIVLVAICSFGLGRWSVSSQSSKNVILPALVPYVAATSSQKTTADTNTTTPIENSVIVTGKGQYVASKSGTKYHLLTCPGASQIKEENKIYFTTKAQAEAAGYTPAANCKGI